MYRLQQVLRHSSSFAPNATSRGVSVLTSIDWQSDDRKNGPQRTPFQTQALRFRRHDRASAFDKPRPKTKKQRQTYNRRMKKIDEEKAKHSAPGSKAGPRRQFARERMNELLELSDNKGSELSTLSEEDMEYGMEDALMEDILGNTAHLTSQATPEPHYLGHKHKQYYNVVKDQMDRYREAIEALASADQTNNSNAVLNMETGAASLPSDEAISRVLRAFRDRNGTRSRPIGIAMALEHILKDLGIPIMAFGEYTFTTLLTCCRTPNEARRIFKLMTDQQHPVSSYSWSILVDIHAKMGDFEGCAAVIKEMAHNGVAPTQAAYTSLLAACYKVCNDGRIPHSIRAKAGDLGWKHWQEMRIVGVEADAMAYGAIIRLCSARGQAERAISLLEDMNRFEVKPTTLCFSGALRAVARSHEIGVRFERGWSRKQLRRELITAHHGNMTRQIVIMAENAEVEQDDSFVSALMLCAAAAGDSATAKAVYLASEVRKMDHLRTIGPDSSLQQLRGGMSEADPPKPLTLEGKDSAISTDLAMPESGSHGALQTIDSRQYEPKSFGEREYGKDTRSLSALLKSCGQAIDGNSIGTMWAGRQNQGYLCENSLRLLTTRWEPNYDQRSMPNELSTKFGVNSLRRFDEDRRDEDRKIGAARKKFEGLYLDDDAVTTLEEYADTEMDTAEEKEALEFATRKRTPDGISGTSGGNSGGSLKNDLNDESLGVDGEDDWDEDISFEVFFNELKLEAKKHGSTEEITEEEARELYSLMQEEFMEEFEGDDFDESELSDVKKTQKPADGIDAFGENESSAAEYVDFDEFYKGVQEEAKKHGIHQDLSEQEAQELYKMMQAEVEEDAYEKKVDSDSGDAPSENELYSEELPYTAEKPKTSDSGVPAISDAFLPAETEHESEHQNYVVAELQAALPGMPVERLEQVADAFESTLGYPSMLTLVPLLRETMPDTVSSGWLRKANSRNAEYVLQKAKEDKLVNLPLLNAMLQVKTQAAYLDDAEAFHSEEFRKNNMKPNAYSDRLVLQMFVANGRLSRALKFKERIELEKRTLDLPSYGSLIDYYAGHEQFGSAVMLLKECLNVHGSAPGEADLKRLRQLSRRLNMNEEIDIESMIGVDPVAWLKHGERFLKREKSKKGRRNVRLALL